MVQFSQFNFIFEQDLIIDIQTFSSLPKIIILAFAVLHVLFNEVLNSLYAK